MTSLILSSGISAFISATISIWIIISLWVIFKKAGRKGWEALIPVWNIYILFKIIGKKTWFYFLLLPFIIILLYFFLRIFPIYNTLQGNINLFNSTIYTLLMFMYPFALILALIFLILANFRLVRKFGKSAQFGLGLLFLTPIFLGILAFGGAKFDSVEFDKKYSWKKWLFLAIGMGLVIGCCNAGLKYIFYKPVINEYEYKTGKKDGEFKTTTYDGKEGGGRYENGKQIGHWIEYDLSVKWEGNYNNEGEREGEWKITTEDGKEGGGMYKNGKQVGEWTIYWDLGQKFEGNYNSEGLEEGEWKSYYNNGNLFEIGKYENGKKIGEWTYYRKDGTSTKLIFKDGNPWEGTEITMWGTDREYKDGREMLWVRPAQ